MKNLSGDHRLDDVPMGILNRPLYFPFTPAPAVHHILSNLRHSIEQAALEKCTKKLLIIRSIPVFSSPLHLHFVQKKESSVMAAGGAGREVEKIR